MRKDDTVHELRPEDISTRKPGEQRERLRLLAKQVLKDVRSAQMHKIPMLPGVAARALELSRRADVSIRELESIIQPDAMITARVLAIANSPLYGSGSPVRSLRNAIMRLGVELMCDVLYQTVAEAHIFKGGNERVLRWQRIHAVAVAYLARDISNILPEKLESPFLCGLMHDLGEILLYQAFEDPKESGITEEELPMVVNLIHPHVGQVVAEKWRLPEFIQEATRRHHIYSGYSGGEGYSYVGNVICLADALARSVGLSEDGQTTLLKFSLVEGDLDPAFVNLEINAEQALELHRRAVALRSELGL